MLGKRFSLSQQDINVCTSSIPMLMLQEFQREDSDSDSDDSIRFKPFGFGFFDSDSDPIRFGL